VGTHNRWEASPIPDDVTRKVETLAKRNSSPPEFAPAESVDERRVIIAPSGVPVVVSKSYHRDPRDKAWSFEPVIILAEPLDVRELLDQNETCEEMAQ
jgi:hypothetical protein